MVLTIIFLIPGDISALIDLFSMTVWIFYVLAMVVLLILRKTKPDANRPYKVLHSIANSLSSSKRMYSSFGLA